MDSVYAIVQYDFQAERPDELDAKKGEPIVVIAQSNHEWSEKEKPDETELRSAGSWQSPSAAWVDLA